MTPPFRATVGLISVRILDRCWMDRVALKVVDERSVKRQLARRSNALSAGSWQGIPR